MMATNDLVYLGGLRAWFSTTTELSTTEKSRISNIIQEVVSETVSSQKVGGKIRIGGLIFQEYKAGSHNVAALRFFGFQSGKSFCLAAIARHVKNSKVNRYEGMTWDGKDQFAPDYVGSSVDVTDIVPAAFEEYLDWGK